MAENDTLRAASVTADATIDAVFRRVFTMIADHRAATSEESSITYAELRDRSWRRANALHGERRRYPGQGIPSLVGGALPIRGEVT